MNNLFIIQLIVSFIVGGSIIAILSFAAERVNKTIAGIIIAFPSTVALGFFFLGWTISPEAVAKIVPSTLIPLGLSILFAAVYPYVAEFIEKFTKKKLLQIVISLLISIGLWFALAIPIVINKFDNLLLGIIGFFILITIAHLLLKRKNFDKPITLKYTIGQKISRAVFVGFIIFLVVLFGKILNPFWGGMLSMFPASFTSVVMIIHWHYGVVSIFPMMQKTAVGSLSLFVYAIIAMYSFPEFGFVIGTLVAYFASLVVTLGLIIFSRKKKR